MIDTSCVIKDPVERYKRMQDAFAIILEDMSDEEYYEAAMTGMDTVEGREERRRKARETNRMLEGSDVPPLPRIPDEDEWEDWLAAHPRAAEALERIKRKKQMT